MECQCTILTIGLLYNISFIIIRKGVILIYFTNIFFKLFLIQFCTGYDYSMIIVGGSFIKIYGTWNLPGDPKKIELIYNFKVM